MGTHVNRSLLALLLAMALPLLLPETSSSQEISDKKLERRMRRALRRNEPGAFPGFTMITPLRSKTVYLVNMRGEIAHTWVTDYAPGNSVYLLDNGNLIRAAQEPTGEVFSGGGIGGRIQEFNWDGEVVWDYVYANDDHWHHHDVQPMPNGNILFLAWERKTKEEVLESGRDPSRVLDGGIWPDHVIEVKPERPAGGTIVWEWHLWDHLVQDLDPKKKNYGKPADHPELLHINSDRQANEISDEDTKRLQALGYIDAPKDNRPPPRLGLDWNHSNSIHYNPSLDQIVISVRRMDELWIIDHSTTTEEAAGHSGGKSGKGGDFLYRWGNPRIYDRGTEEDQRLFGQHDVQWIPASCPGGGNLLFFNNGNNRTGTKYSSVEEIALPLAESGGYVLEAGKSYGPAEALWSYTARRKEKFYSSFISGAQRLENGNTLICAGEHGKVFEVTTEGEVVWEWINPFGGEIEENQVSLTALFRATRLSPDHPGLQGKMLGDVGAGTGEE